MNWAGAVLLMLVGLWLFLQSVAGGLPTRLLKLGKGAVGG